MAAPTQPEGSTRAPQTREAFRIRGDLGDVGRNARGEWAPAEEGDELAIKMSFRAFVTTFTDSDTDNFTDGKYLLNLRKLLYGSQYQQLLSLAVSLSDVAAFDNTLLNYALTFPADSLVFMDEVVTDLLHEEIEGESDSFVRVALYNHPTPQPLRSLNPNELETLVAVGGVVIRVSSVLPDMQIAAFTCQNTVVRNQESVRCDFLTTVQLIEGEITEPNSCPSCHKNHSMALQHDLCVFGSKQLLKLQEPPDAIPEGEAPKSVQVYVYDDLIDVAKPGDRIEVTGVLRASSLRTSTRQRTVKSVFRTFVDACHVTFKSTSSEHASHVDLVAEVAPPNCVPSPPAEHPFPAETIEEFLTFSRQRDVYSQLVQALAPNIWEHDDVKKGLLCQLFGGTSKVMGAKKGRGDVHILLCGDPSTAKSQLLTYSHKLAPRGIYTCGRGTSAAGLTASVTRDMDTKEFVLESGAVVLSDRGICCIDEFDKLDESSRIILHEVMEQQTVSIAKAGLVCSLNARTAILASANPIGSRYDTKKSVVENINLPPTLLSRFDLIYLILDTCEPEKDRSLARHLCALYSTEGSTLSFSPVTKEFLTQYISYAKAFVHPRLGTEASQRLLEHYRELRLQGVDSVGRSLTATPRQLESIIRIAEAQARMRLQSLVTVDHVDEAVRLIKASTYSSIVDPVTGRIDFDQLHTGISDAAKIRRELLEKGLKEILKDLPTGQARDPLLTALNGFLERHERPSLDEGRSSGIRSEVDPVLREMESTGAIVRTSGGSYVLAM